LDEHCQKFVILSEEETEVRSFLAVEGPLLLAVVVGVGVLRLRERFAARNAHYAQDDRVLGVGNVSYRPPKPACCMEFFEMSLVDEMPDIRNLKSSAFDALSRAVS
jgi:hypothetical protein